jgi:uncharacterized protein (TIGR02646 family)
MIRVKRGPVPASLDGSNSPGVIETKKAIAAVARGDKFEYTAYKADDVVLALRMMFNKKCAYCEFPYAAGGPEDIEHFRPKGGVVINGKLETPGYYWLGAEWTNLLPACPDCNRKRRKEFEQGVDVSGKANIFPVEDETKRWRNHRAECKEVHLLLNPCDDKPESHLEFLRDGVIRAKKRGSVESLRGLRSIEVFGLRRSDLVEQRAEKERLVRTAVERALKAAEIAVGERNSKRRAAQEQLASDLLNDARKLLEPQQPYLAVARAVFKEYGLK